MTDSMHSLSAFCAERAVRLAEKVGFKVSSRQAIYKDGELYDNLMMDLLREEYFALHPELKDHLPGLEIKV
jgi:hypothetical protein